MELQLYLFPFLKAFLIAVVFIMILIFFSGKIKIKGRNSFRHIHGKNTSRLGGVAVILAFFIAVLADKNLVISASLWSILIASSLILIIGLFDDFLELDWKIQLFLQIAIAVLIFILGVRVEFITNPFGGFIFLNLGKYLLPSLIFVIFWLLILINAMNWLDGIDGLSGGITFLGALTIFFLSLKPEVNQPPVGIITMALAGAVLGFLIFNFHPAKILAGTSGSMFMGFILGVLAIFAGTKIATALLIMAIPILDLLWVIGERIRSGSSIFSPDRRHLHYKLMELGWSQKRIAFFFCLVTLLIALIALNTRATGKLISIALVIIVMAGVLFSVNKKISTKKITYD